MRLANDSLVTVEIPMLPRPSLCVRLTCALALPLFVAACGESQEPAKGKSASQVAAKVNEDEISVHQVNAELVRVGATAPEQRSEAKRQVLQGLIDQQLLVQQALEQRLHRDPDVLAAIEAARHSLLAQAYVQKRVAASARPTEEEIRKYYAENPALFSERRVFRLLELATDMTPDRMAEVQATIGKSRNLMDVGNALKAAGANVVSSAAVRAPEQLPLEFVARIAEMKDGQVAALANDRSITVLQIVESQRQPLSEKEATPLIEQFLSNQRRAELTRAELKRLRGEAKIEYVGEFTKLAQEAAAAPAAATGAAKTAEEGKSLEKGITGLR